MCERVSSARCEPWDTHDFDGARDGVGGALLALRAFGYFSYPSLSVRALFAGSGASLAKNSAISMRLVPLLLLEPNL